VNIKILAVCAVAATVATPFAFTYRSDSGVSQEDVSTGTGGQFVWIQQFVVSGGNSLITGVSTTFGVSGATAGESFNVYVWRGTPTGAGADAPTLVAQATGTVDAGSINTDVLQTVGLNASITGTSNFFIGAAINFSSNQFPGALQTTGTGSFPIVNTAWFAGNGTTDGFNPNDINGVANDELWALHDPNINLPGNWLIRAEATVVPEPVSMAALVGGLGALAMRRRRRKA